MNKVGPYNNPQETYNYYYLPFCAPLADDKPAHKWAGLGEVLGGNELIDSQLNIKFKSKLLYQLRARASPLAQEKQSGCFSILGS